MRTEAEVFGELAGLCQSSGYIHALAYLCFRDNIVRYSGTMHPKDLLPMFSSKRLIRTEISTLIGLMIKVAIDWDLPTPENVQDQISRTDALLKELHETFLPPMSEVLGQHGSVPDPQLLSRGDFLREAIFYGGESAYTFQYRDLASEKYDHDDNWLKANKGFVFSDARAVAHAIARLQERKLMETVSGMMTAAPDQWSILPGYSFTASEVSALSAQPIATVEAVLTAFALRADERNDAFCALDDFNAANATPLLRCGEQYVLLQSYSLVEAMYESPFYWMLADKAYAPIALQNRGRYTEQFCRSRLELVFGKDRVFTNVNLVESKARRIGEIDVLVLFGDRVLILQSKSKRLTIEARKGSDGQIRQDFKKSVQDSYDQALSCAQHLGNPNISLIDDAGNKVDIPAHVKEIYLVCAISDHYPALHFQARQFLKYTSDTVIQAPLVLDVFALDAITEMLPSPIRFLSYVNRRTNYTERLHVTHETVILSYHLKRNLWMEDNLDVLWLSDDISADLDVAMAVRRDGVAGERTPNGILTRFSSTALGRIFAAIERQPDAGVIDLGFLLLSMSEKATFDASNAISHLAQLARGDGTTHDLTIGFNAPKSGLTVHCSDDPAAIAEARLKDHCERRKYSQRAGTWFGLCLHPSDESLRFGLKLEYPWQSDRRLEALTRRAARGGNLRDVFKAARKRPKLGRNDPCPCGSGRKYKKCHGQ